MIKLKDHNGKVTEVIEVIEDIAISQFCISSACTKSSVHSM